MTYHYLPTEAAAHALVALIREEGMRAYVVGQCGDKWEVREWF